MAVFCGIEERIRSEWAYELVWAVNVLFDLLGRNEGGENEK